MNKSPRPAQFAPQIAAEFCDGYALFENESRFGIAKLHAFFSSNSPLSQTTPRPAQFAPQIAAEFCDGYALFENKS
jgi:hypothetical protein